MSTWIKICGMTTAEAIAAALDAGVDAIGFVFADSPRRMSPTAAAGLAVAARGRALCVAVTRHPTQRDLDEVIAEFKPDMLQTDADDLVTLSVPHQLERLPVFRHWQEEKTWPRRLLFEGLKSGSGLPCDWEGARRVTRAAQVVLAGGLNAANVATAIAEVRPFGVDVSSGVETRPGIKSPVEIARFVSAVRALDITTRRGGVGGGPPQEKA